MRQATAGHQVSDLPRAGQMRLGTESVYTVSAFGSCVLDTAARQNDYVYLSFQLLGLQITAGPWTSVSSSFRLASAPSQHLPRGPRPAGTSRRHSASAAGTWGGA